ncbi:MAG: N-acetylmuramoyl-L-alanine amidase [Acidimicrobiales bacterium]|nr:N-acetylmuramoyl-L-alanine amidase [Acidimicrobiales bacterium]
MHRLGLAILCLAVMAAAAPARTAPAIGPWLGAPRGSFDLVRGVGDAIEVSGTVRDPDSASALDVAILVDGERVQRLTTDRPGGFGEPVSFTTTVATDPGLHRVCLRLLGDSFGHRTVDCRDATTAPPRSVDPAVEANATGVLVTPTGVVAPVLGVDGNDYTVLTPCGAEATLSEGTFVERARVVIDAGHGGSESGAVGVGITEKNLNLVVAELVVEKLESLGISAQLTRTWDYRVPIKTRADIAAALAPDIFVSVHHNGGARRASVRPGTEVFYAEGMPESERAARIMYEEMVDALDDYSANWVSTVNEGASLRLREEGDDLYGIHRYSPGIPSIITEFVYLSNPSEAALMRQVELQELEADTIVSALLRWWWTDEDGSSRGRQFVDSSSSGTGGFDGCADPPLVGNSPLARRESTLALQQAELGRQAARALTPALFLATDPAVD